MSIYGKNPLQYCKVISLQLIKINEKNNNKIINFKNFFNLKKKGTSEHLQVTLSLNKKKPIYLVLTSSNYHLIFFLLFTAKINNEISMCFHLFRIHLFVTSCNRGWYYSDFSQLPSALRITQCYYLFLVLILFDFLQHLTDTGYFLILSSSFKMFFHILSHSFSYCLTLVPLPVSKLQLFSVFVFFFLAFLCTLPGLTTICFGFFSPTIIV